MRGERNLLSAAVVRSGLGDAWLDDTAVYVHCNFTPRQQALLPLSNMKSSGTRVRRSIGIILITLRNRQFMHIRIPHWTHIPLAVAAPARTACCQSGNAYLAESDRLHALETYSAQHAHHNDARDNARDNCRLVVLVRQQCLGKNAPGGA